MTRSLLLSTSTLTRFGVNGVEAALALDFIGSEYRTANTATTFADAFMGNSPKLTYSTTSNSTMVNSSGEIVWAPHNLEPDSNDITNYSVLIGASIIDSETFTTSGSSGDALTGRIITSADLNATYTVRAQIWSETDAGTAVNFGVRTIGITDDVKSITLQSTPTWEELESDITGATQFRGIKVASSSAATIKIRNISVYRSDLGGMAPVPGADTGFETYVPTNGNEVYLPRVGHHVYNGSTWVNEGLLIESEQRTNLFDHSEAIVGSDVGNGTSALDGATAQGANAYQISLSALTIDTSAAQGFYLYGSLGTGEHAFSVLLKAGQYTDIRIRRGNVNVDTTTIGTVDLSTGAVTNIDGELTVEPQGNGWFRVSWTDNVKTAGITGFAIKPNSTTHATSNGTDYFLLSQPQVEAASTPSSYIPTDNSTVTRGGQSLTVPPAQFGWDSSAVSIQMDGRMTYADEDANSTAMLVHWNDAANNVRLQMRVDTAAGTGRIVSIHRTHTPSDICLTPVSSLTPGVLEPFSVANRFGSTFSRLALDGVLTTENTDPTALPDLSNTDLQIAKDFMGTIGTFRQFAGDIGDAGLEEATS